MLTLLAQLAAGQHAMPLFGIGYISYEIGMFFFLGLASVLLFLADSARFASRFAEEASGQIKIGALYRTIELPRGEAILLLAIATFGIGSSGNLAELYRASASTWHDALLWSIEGSLIALLIEWPINLPRFWDLIYQFLWVIVFLALAALARRRDTVALARVLCAIIIAFHVTRYIAIAFPTAGPVFYRPELFNISGTGTAAQVTMLREFMAGAGGSGLLPGTQALPSLHVGLAWCAVVVLATMKRMTLWLTVPWFVLNWASTVFLGWHYVMDGIGGILVMSVSLYLSRLIFVGVRVRPIQAEPLIGASKQGV